MPSSELGQIDIGMLCFHSNDASYASMEVLMPITLRNKATEALIRELGKARREGPSATIARLAREAKQQEEQAWEAEKERRRQLIPKLRALVPQLTEDDRHAIDRAMEDMYDENGLPK
jgi:hypothetical protein